MLTQLGSMVGGIAEINMMAWMYLGPALMAVQAISTLLLWLAYDTVRANAAGKAAMKSALQMKTAGWTMLMAGFYVNGESWMHAQMAMLPEEAVEKMDEKMEEKMDDDMFAIFKF